MRPLAVSMTLLHHHAAANTIGIASSGTVHAGDPGIRRHRVDDGGTRLRCVSGGDGLLLTVIAFALVMLLGVTYRRGSVMLSECSPSWSHNGDRRWTCSSGYGPASYSVYLEFPSPSVCAWPTREPPFSLPSPASAGCTPSSGRHSGRCSCPLVGALITRYELSGILILSFLAGALQVVLVAAAGLALRRLLFWLRMRLSDASASQRTI